MNLLLIRTWMMDENARTSGNFTEMVPGLIDLSTVFFFKAGIYTTAQLHSRLNSVYLYSFDFKGTQTQHNPLLHSLVVLLMQMICCIYFLETQIPRFNADQQFISDTLIDYWVNFATTGDPSTFANGSTTPTVWPRFGESTGQYLTIDKKIEVHNDYPGSWVGASKDLNGLAPEEEDDEDDEDDSSSSRVELGKLELFALIAVSIFGKLAIN